jgi:hypothetical protein
MSDQELRDLGAPWYCDNCGQMVTRITTYTDEDLELDIQKAANRSYEEYDDRFLDEMLIRKEKMKDHDNGKFED